ncbi:MAG: transcriptional regulator [Clostridia bacterium]|nr:transcriptional regulator [Clostridia bacterium]
MERFKTFTLLIAKINRNIRKIKNEEMAEFGLKSPHVSCLYYLYKENSLTAKELSDICDEDKGAVSRSIDRLEKLGYLACDSESKKRYKAPLSLTQSGRDVARRIAEKIDAVLDFVGEALEDDERLKFYESLSAVCDNLQKFCEKYNTSN